MQGIALIILREVVEISLILSVILAATRGLAGRMPFILGGLAAGVAGAALIALFAENISALANGAGQEWMNASILLSAALMIGWTTVWMRVHGKDLSRQLRKMGEGIRQGEASFWALSGIIALTMFREGSEIVLFSYGMLASGIALQQLMLGALIGLVGGTLVGVMLYLGMVKFFTRHFFSVTSWLLTLLSAGMVAKAVQFLQTGDIIRWGSIPLWNSSTLLDESSGIGRVANVLIGYTAEPNLAQLLAYLATVGVIFFGIRITRLKAERKSVPHRLPLMQV